MLMKTDQFFVFLFGMAGNIWLIKKLLQVWRQKKSVAKGFRILIISIFCQIILKTWYFLLYFEFQEKFIFIC